MSSTPYESATLLIRLYELRRDDTMREARNWFARMGNHSETHLSEHQLAILCAAAAGKVICSVEADDAKKAHHNG